MFGVLVLVDSAVLFRENHSFSVERVLLCNFILAQGLLACDIVSFLETAIHLLIYNLETKIIDKRVLYNTTVCMISIKPRLDRATYRMDATEIEAISACQNSASKVAKG